MLFRPRTVAQLCCKVGPSPSCDGSMMATSADDGKTWSAAKRCRRHSRPDQEQARQLANGDIVSKRAPSWRLRCIWSSTDSATWTATPPLNDGKALPAVNGILVLGRPPQAVGRTQVK